MPGPGIVLQYGRSRDLAGTLSAPRIHSAAREPERILSIFRADCPLLSRHPRHAAPCDARRSSSVAHFLHSRSTAPALARSLGFVSVYFLRSFPLHWALLRDNSCARQLRVFCFSGSSQQIF